MGLALVGGRLVAGNAMPAALFVYENTDQQRLTLQVRKQTAHTDEVAFRYALEDGVGVYYWIEDDCTYALSGTVDRTQLLTVGRVAYGQLAVVRRRAAEVAGSGAAAWRRCMRVRKISDNRTPPLVPAAIRLARPTTACL